MKPISTSFDHPGISRIIMAAMHYCAFGILAVLTACNAGEASAPVAPKVAYLQLQLTDGPIIVGDARAITAAPFSATGTLLERQVSWQSSNDAIASVNSDGRVTAHTEGVVMITASCEGKTASVQMTVIAPAPVPAISALSPTSVVAGKSESFALTISGSGFTRNTRVTWDGAERGAEFVSAVTLRMMVDPADVAIAKSVQVGVVNPAPGGGHAQAEFVVELTKVSRVTIESPWGTSWTWVGHRLPLSAIAEDQLGRELANRQAAWSVDDGSVASTTPTGVRDVAVFGKAPGETLINATVDGVRAGRNIRVHEAPAFDVVYEAGEGDERHLKIWDLASGSAPSRLRTDVVAFNPSPSPDGRQVAFAGMDRGVGPNADVDIFIADRNGEYRRFMANESFDSDPAWSPDGQRIAFVSARSSGNLDVFVASIDGSGLRKLTNSAIGETEAGSGLSARSPAWSPDGKLIAYSVGTSVGSQIWVMNSDGSGKRQLTGSADADDYEPSWHPHGSLVVFRRQYRHPQRAMVMTVRPDGTGTSMIGGRLVSAAAGPSYSPDGRWLMASSDRDAEVGSLHAFSVDADAGVRVVIPSALGGGRSARWMRKR